MLFYDPDQKLAVLIKNTFTCLKGFCLKLITHFRLNTQKQTGIAFGYLAVVGCTNLYLLSEVLFREEKGLGLEVGAESGKGMN